MIMLQRSKLVHCTQDGLRNTGMKLPAGLQFYEKETPALAFPVNIAKFLTTTILKNICKRLLLWVMEQSVDLLIRRQTFLKWSLSWTFLYLLLRRFNEIFYLN